MKLGIVGLPNVGKSTLFNAITKAGAQAANYPFCTIEPNTGIVPVPDKRLDVLTKMYNPKKRIPASVTFVDIAGLVKGASRGEGLGNKFLSHIREVDAIVHVVRCFADENVIHVDGTVDSARDIEEINLELIFADLETVQKRTDKAEKQIKTGDKKYAAEAELGRRLIAHLEAGRPARTFAADEDEQAVIDGWFLLTDKPVIYAANIAEDDIGKPIAELPLAQNVESIAKAEGAEVFTISARIEEEIGQMDAEEKQAFLEDLGIGQSGLDRLIRASYRLLGLISFFTVGEDECRAWTIKNGTKAPQAAGTIHTDFERGFIRAEIVGYDQLIEQGSMAACKEKGLVRSEGKEYVMKDGDITLIRFNVQQEAGMGKLIFFVKRLFRMDLKRYRKTMKFLVERSGKSRPWLVWDMLVCALRYNAGYMDYKIAEMYHLNDAQKKTVITRGISNAIVRRMNDKAYWHLFDDKATFNTLFKDDIRRSWMQLSADTPLAEFKAFLKENPDIIAKPLEGSSGVGIARYTETDFQGREEAFQKELLDKGIGIIEQRLIQHDRMMEMCPTSVNTVRIATLLGEKKQGVVYAFLRIGVGAVMDNVDCGGMAARVDLDTGKLLTVGADKAGNTYEIHPITGTRIIGFEVPYFWEAMDMCLRAAQKVPQMRFIAWDVAITNAGPCFIEGNSFPSHAVPQFAAHYPDGMGIMREFREFIEIQFVRITNPSEASISVTRLLIAIKEVLQDKNANIELMKLL